MASSAIPILVLGTARSGTTWLTNLLLSYSGVSGIAHPLHWGAHEVPLYSMGKYWGSLRSPGDYLRFLHATTATDLWQIGDDELEYWLQTRPSTVTQWFLDYMDRLAARRGTRYWAVKLDPRLMSDARSWAGFRDVLSNRYPNACLVGIFRSRDDVLTSYRNMPGRYYRRRQSLVGSASATLLGLARYRHQNARMNRVLAEMDGIRIEYADLRRSVADTLAPIELRLPDLGQRSDLNWPRNTSFRSGKAEEFRLGTAGEVVDRLLARFPALGGAITQSWDRVRGVRDPASTRLLQARYFPTELEEEFGNTGLNALIPFISQMRSSIGSGEGSEDQN